MNAMAGSSSRFLPMDPIFNGRSIFGVNKKKLVCHSVFMKHSIVSHKSSKMKSEI